MAILNVMVSNNTPLPPYSEALREIYDKVLLRLDTMHQSTEGWRVDKFGKDDQCSISTNVVSSGRVMVRFDGLLEIDVFNLASMIYEVDLFPEWVPFCNECENIKTIPVASKIVKISFSVPIISKREAFLYGQGVDRIEHSNSVMVYCEAVTGNEDVEKRHNVSLQKAKGSVMLDLKFFVCEITIIKKGTYRFRAFGDIDLNVTFLPDFLLGILTKKIGNWIFDKMIKMANNLKGTKYEKRIQEDSEGFYKWLAEKINKFETKAHH